MTLAILPPHPDSAWAWFFDFDGTLAAIAESPGRVRIDPQMRRVVRALHREAGGAVALVTGRTLADVDRFFPELALAAAGQHGSERRDATGRVTRHHLPTPRLAPARDELAELVARHPGLVLEDKGMALALHYRRAPRLAGYAHRVARRMAARLGPTYCVQGGKRIVEIRPAGRDKGTAIRDFMREPPFRGRRPVFLGDDTTDEFGFAVVNRMHGLSIKIGTGPTVARWRLRDVEAVRGWLEDGQPTLRAVR